MSYTDTTVRWTYTGDGSTVEFAYTTKIEATTWLEVYVDDVLQSSGYSVDGVSNDGGGNVTFTTAPASAAAITIVKVVPLTQARSFPNTGDLDTTEIEAALDKLTMVAQQVDNKAGARSMTQPESDTADIGDLPTKANRLGKWLRFNATTGDPEAAGATDLGADAVQGDGISISGSTFSLDEAFAATWTAAQTFTGPFIWTKGGDIASASPLVIDTDGNYFDVTGTTGFSAMTVAAGRFFALQFDGALTMTDGASLDLGGANITTAAGDRGLFYATATDTVQLLQFFREGQVTHTLLDEDTMSSDSATQGATQQSIKAYVDTQVQHSQSYYSGAQTLTYDAILNIPAATHGLTGNKYERIIRAWGVCNDAGGDAGYAQNDVINFPEQGGADFGWTAKWDAGDDDLDFIVGAGIRAKNPSTFNDATLTASKWDLHILVTAP